MLNTPTNKLKQPKQKIKCPYCNSKDITKAGKRKNKQQTIQKHKCKSCNKNFTNQDLNQSLKYKTYPTKIILNAISLYNLGYSQQKTSNILNKKFKIIIPQRTISQWVNEFKNTLPYQKIRQSIIKLYLPEEIIETYTFLHNNLPYKFQIHKGKLDFIFKSNVYNNKFSNISKFEIPIKNYLEKITTKEFPHHIFKEFKENNQEEKRASQLRFNYLKFTKLTKNNLANKLTKLALNLANTNKQRHQVIQDFMLINDTTTIATEIPIYLTMNDIKYFKQHKFIINLENYRTPITGHIDILQIRNNLIHILDYKPEADKQNPIEQLTIYALALASRTKLDLKSFKVAWFDENNYYEFFPLHVIYNVSI